ncbi:unnamed protein product [Amoebophrya sp. A120]|nr:unnamed protein product [Amoebophrya sp. A120]|eukprot:GSA120T00022220001.1
MKLSDGPDAVLSKAAPSSSDTNARNKELQEAVTARLSQFVDHAGRHRRTAEEDDSVFAEALLAREKKAMLASRSLPSTPPRRGIDTKRETDLNRSPGASSTGSKKDRFHPIATPEPEDYDYQHLPPQIAHATAPAPSGRQMDHRGVDLEMLPTYNLMQQINMMHNFPLLHQQEGFLATGGELSNTSAADCSSNYTGTGSETTASGVLAQGSPCSSSAELQQYQLSGGGNNTITFSPGMHHMIPCYFPAPVTVPAGTVVRVPVAQDGQAQGSGEGGVPVSNVMPHEQEIFHPDETQITPKNTPRNGD